MTPGSALPRWQGSGDAPTSGPAGTALPSFWMPKGGRAEIKRFSIAFIFEGEGNPVSEPCRAAVAPPALSPIVSPAPTVVTHGAERDRNGRFLLLQSRERCGQGA